MKPKTAMIIYGLKLSIDQIPPRKNYVDDDIFDFKNRVAMFCDLRMKVFVKTDPSNFEYPNIYLGFVVKRIANWNGNLAELTLGHDNNSNTKRKVQENLTDLLSSGTLPNFSDEFECKYHLVFEEDCGLPHQHLTNEQLKQMRKVKVT